MFNRTTDGSLDNEAVKIVSALKPFWKKWTDEWGRNCVRSKKMTVTTAPSVVTGLIGVTDAFSDTECMIPYKGDVALAQAGDTVWVKWMYDNQQTMYAECMGNIVKPVGTSDSTPYFYRPSGGGSLGAVNRETDKLIGGTIAWNQLVQNGNFQSASGWYVGSRVPTVADGVASFTATTDGTLNLTLTRGASFVKGHKVLCLAHVWCDTQNRYRFRYPFISAIQSVTANTWTIISTVGIVESVANFGVQADSVNGATYKYKDIFAVDLTAMFGSAIADYAYTSGTAGAGIAWLKSYGFFTAPYYAYDAGSLQSVKASAHKTVGFNQWDEEWEVGGISTADGSTISNNNAIRSKNFIPCLPNTEYYTKSVNPACYLWFYDANKNFISFITNNVNHVRTTPSNCYYMKIRVGDLSHPLQSYNNDICINLSKTTGYPQNGHYEPYSEHSYALDDIELRGMLKLDANHHLYYDGDEYVSDGTVTRKYGIVDLGTLSWSYSAASGTQLQRFNTSGIASLVKKEGTVFLGVVCPKYIAVSDPVYSRTIDKAMCILSSNGMLYIVDSAYTSAADFKTAMSGVYLVYELATPTTETADTYTNPQVVDASGTEQYVDASYTAGTRDFEMPVGHDTEYYVLQSFEQQIYDTPQTDGTYRLICKVVNGEASLEWIRDDVTVV